MLTKGHKILILAFIGLVVIGGLIVLMFGFGGGDNDGTDKEKGEIGGAAIPKEVAYEVPALSEAEIDQNKITNQSIIFVERFATYSNQSTQNKIEELKGMMTEGFYTWASSQYVDKLAIDYSNNGDYSSVVTDAVAVQFENYSSNEAEVIVETKRTHLKLSEEETIVSQKIRLEYVNQQSEWKVSGAFWLDN